MSQHEMLADKIPIEIEQIYQHTDSIMKDHNSSNKKMAANVDQNDVQMN